MNNFVDRESPNINKKILEINKIELDETGELKRLYVTEYRDDSEGLTSEGTPLTAEYLNDIVEKICTKMVRTPEKIIQIDMDDLVLNKDVYADFILPSEGKNGSHITWKVKSGDKITIQDNCAIVNRDSFFDETTVLTATFTYEDLTRTKDYEFIVMEESLKLTYKPTTTTFRWVQKKGSLNSSKINIISNTNEPIYVKQRYISEYVDIVINQNSTTNVEVNIKETTYLNSLTEHAPIDYSIDLEISPAVAPNVVKNTKKINIIYQFLSSNPLD